MKIRYLLAVSRLMARDNDGGDESQADDSGDSGQGDAGGIKFTPEQQAKVDEIVVKRNRKVREQLEQTERRYEQLMANQNLSTKEKEELQNELQNLQSSFRTREEQLRYESKKRETEIKQTLEQREAEAKQYRTLFETQTRNNSIIAAASQHEAYNPEQFIHLLADRTEVLAEENERGEKTGRYVPRVRVNKKTEDGTVSEVYVTPEEAIEDMKNDVGKYGNLFRGNVAKGIGEGSNSSFAGNARVDVSKMSDAEYFANRKQIAEQYGIRGRRSRNGF